MYIYVLKKSVVLIELRVIINYGGVKLLMSSVSLSITGNLNKKRYYRIEVDIIVMGFIMSKSMLCT